jgi:hypothetical protein
MKYTIGIRLKIDEQQAQCKVFRPKGIVLEDNNREFLEEVYSHDINVLTTGLIFAIRKGGEFGLFNKLHVLEKTIDAFKKEYSDIAPQHEFANITHSVGVFFDSDAPVPAINIFHKKSFKFDATKGEEVAEMFYKDIETLKAGLIVIIRQASELNIINKVETIDGIIEYMTQQVSEINISQVMPKELETLHNKKLGLN